MGPVKLDLRMASVDLLRLLGRFVLGARSEIVVLQQVIAERRFHIVLLHGNVSQLMGLVKLRLQMGNVVLLRQLRQFVLEAPLVIVAL
jgi:hypothetical protein